MIFEKICPVNLVGEFFARAASKRGEIAFFVRLIFPMKFTKQRDGEATSPDGIATERLIEDRGQLVTFPFSPGG